MNNEIGHYVVTAHPAGGVLLTAKCNFLSPFSVDVLVAKSRRLEVRRLRTATEERNATAASSSSSSSSSSGLPSPFPVLVQVPVNGRLTVMLPLTLRNCPTQSVFLLTERFRYAVIGHDPTAAGPYPVRTQASGSLRGEEHNILGRESESGPIGCMDHSCRCIALHIYDGLITILPVDVSYSPPKPTKGDRSEQAGGSDHLASSGKMSSWSRHHHHHHHHRQPQVLKKAFHCRIEERTVLAMCFLQTPDGGSSSNSVGGGSSTCAPPQLCVLHQDARGAQHVTSHVVDLQKRQLHLYGSAQAPAGTQWLRKSSLDGGSSMLIPVPPPIPAAPAAAAAAAAPAAAAASADQPPATTGGFGAGTGNAAQPTKRHAIGGVVVIGQRQLTYCSSNSIKVVPVPQALFLTSEELPADPAGMARYLLGDEFGNLHMLTLVQVQDRIVALQVDTLGSCTLSTALSYLGEGLVYVGSALGDSQLVQIHDEPISNVQQDCGGGGGGGGGGTQQQQQAQASHQHQQHPDAAEEDDDVDLLDTTYLSVVEEYTNLGPILDFDLVPTAPGSAAPQQQQAAAVAAASGGGDSGGRHGGSSAIQQQQQQQIQQSQVVTASGSSKSGSIRLIRNGIGMNEYACQEMPGIQNMWSLRGSCREPADAYLVQSFVGETRVLGVTTTAATTASLEEDAMMMAVEDDDRLQLKQPPASPEDLPDQDGENNDDDEEEEVGGTLEEVFLPGLDSVASTLYIGNVLPGDCIVQITETQIRLASPNEVLDVWSDDSGGQITVATANEAGQIAVALTGGMVLYFFVTANQGGEGPKLVQKHRKQMDRQVSCLDLHPFADSQRQKDSSHGSSGGGTAMEIENDDNETKKVAAATTTTTTTTPRSPVRRSGILAVGLWDDFTVRLLSLQDQDDDDARPLDEMLRINLSTEEDDGEDTAEATDSSSANAMDTSTANPTRRNRNNMMARSLSLTTLDFSSSSSTANGGGGGNTSSNQCSGVNMLFVGLGDGTLISFAVLQEHDSGRLVRVWVQCKKEVCLGTRSIGLVPLSTERGGTCVLATGDRPTVIYLAGMGGTGGSAMSSSSSSSSSSQQHLTNPKLCYSNVNLSTTSAEDGDDASAAVDDVSRPPQQQSIAVTVAAPFFSPVLFDAAHMGQQHYSLAVADDDNLRLGVIDDIQKLHVTTCRLGMAPRRIVHCPELRLFAVGCIESGIKHFGLGVGDDANLGNCIRFMDDTNFDDIERIDLEPYEMVLSMLHATLKVPDSLVAGDATTATETATAAGAAETGSTGAVAGSAYRPFLLVGTAYALPDEDEPQRGRILVYSAQASEPGAAATAGGGAAAVGGNRAVRPVAELSTTGGVYSMCQFYDGRILCTVNSKTMIAELVHDGNCPGTGALKIAYCGAGHHGHILSLFVKSRAAKGPPVLEAAAAAASAGVGGGTPSTSHVTQAQSASAGNGTASATAMDLVENTTASGDKKDDDAAGGDKKKSSKSKDRREMLAIVGDLMRSISLVQYYPQHETLEEVARDFNANWTTAVEMLSDDLYLGAENWNNLYTLRRNSAAASEEVRCRLDTMGEFHLGEMCNKFMSGSLVMPVVASNLSSASATARAGSSTPSNSRRSVRRGTPLKKAPDSSSSQLSSPPGTATKAGAGAVGRIRRPVVATGSQTLFGTVDGTLGVILGLDGPSMAFFACLERAMADVIRPVGDFSHQLYRARVAERQRIHPAHGFVDGDLVESFLDLDRTTMERVVAEMNRDGSWDVNSGGDGGRVAEAGGNGSGNDDGAAAATAENAVSGCKETVADDNDNEEERPELSMDDVLAMVEEMTMLH